MELMGLAMIDWWAMVERAHWNWSNKWNVLIDFIMERGKPTAAANSLSFSFHEKKKKRVAQQPLNERGWMGCFLLWVGYGLQRSQWLRPKKTTAASHPSINHSSSILFSQRNEEKRKNWLKEIDLFFSFLPLLCRGEGPQQEKKREEKIKNCGSIAGAKGLSWVWLLVGYGRWATARQPAKRANEPAPSSSPTLSSSLLLAEHESINLLVIGRRPISAEEFHSTILFELFHFIFFG